MCLCTITDDSSNVVGGGQVACEGHAENLQRVFSTDVRQCLWCRYVLPPPAIIEDDLLSFGFI